MKHLRPTEDPTVFISYCFSKVEEDEPNDPEDEGPELCLQVYADEEYDSEEIARVTRSVCGR